MSRTKPAEERRADLLAAGRTLFVEKGIAATTLEDVTRAAGVSKGLFYLYFHSKDDLLEALQEQFADELAGRTRAAAAREQGWAEKLDACVRATFVCYRELAELHEVLFRRGSDDVREQAPSRHGDAIREILEGGVEAGAFQLEHPEITATLMFVAMHAFDPHFHGPGPPDDELLVRVTQQLFRRAAGVPDAGVSG